MRLVIRPCLHLDPTRRHSEMSRPIQRPLNILLKNRKKNAISSNSQSTKRLLDDSTNLLQKTRFRILYSMVHPDPVNRQLSVILFNEFTLETGLK